MSNVVDLEVQRMELFILKNNYNDEEVKYYLEIQEKIGIEFKNDAVLSAVNLLRERYNVK